MKKGVSLLSDWTIEKQLELAEAYTAVHHEYKDKSNTSRELACLKVLYPVTCMPLKDEDLFAGRFHLSAVGFANEPTVGNGTGHYCIFHKLNSWYHSEISSEIKERVKKLIDYWNINDFMKAYERSENSREFNSFNLYNNFTAPTYLLPRIAGIHLDYSKLINLGINGLRAEIKAAKASNCDDSKSEFYDCLLGSLDILAKVIDTFRCYIDEVLAEAEGKRKSELLRMRDSLQQIREERPQTLIDGLQLSWIYSRLASVVNYGRIDDYLGELLVSDFEKGNLTEEEAVNLVVCLFRFINDLNTTFNGRVILGGKGRQNPKVADEFCRIALKALRKHREVEPQTTLRLYSETPDDIYNLALDCIGEGLTYPMLYNDEVNVPSVEKAFRVDTETAQQYIPYGCGEFMLSGMSVHTPNTCLNILKLLNISINGGIDPYDGLNKSCGMGLKKVQDMTSFEDVFSQLKTLIHRYVELTARAQAESYKLLSKGQAFLFLSLLMEDCVGRGLPVLEGGIRYLGGTNEVYGHISAANALAAIKNVVFERKAYTLEEVVEAANNNFEGYEVLRKELLNAPKYGNDDDFVDSITCELHDYICTDMRSEGDKVGLHSYLVVIINNSMNTTWGRYTSASPEGRVNGQYMQNANNPQSGEDKKGPTMMLNSLVKLSTERHAGSVQNMKFDRNLFNKKRAIVKGLLQTYFSNGGSQIMISVVGREELEKAYNNPEAYPNLLVRVGGFSARFVTLDRDVQLEVMNRTLNS